MQNLINWVEMSAKRGKKSKLQDFEINVYRNTSSKTTNAGNYLSFSSFFTELYKDSSRVRVGLVGTKVVLNFNNEFGLFPHVNKSGATERLRICSSELIDLIYKQNGHDPKECSNIYVLQDIGNNTFLITNK